MTFLLLLLVPGVVIASGDGDIPESEPAPLVDGSMERLAEYETDLNGLSPLDLVLIAMQTVATLLH